MESPTTRGVVGSLLDTPRIGEVRSRPATLVAYDDRGFISSVVEPHQPGYAETIAELSEADNLDRLPEDSFLVPGMVDLHIHAPQFPQLGKALDVPLEVWLNRYTFPLEARYSDLSFAQEVYGALVPTLLANGTTTAVYFGTVHREATEVLVAECLAGGQRAVVGKVAMDHPEGCPDYYRDDSAAAALEETAQFIENVRNHPANGDSLVLAAATPRFVPSCTDDLLAGLGTLAAKTGCLVQTHCSESDWAHQYGMDRYGRSDTMTYEAFGLLRRGTVLAHSNFIDEADMALVASRGAAVAHCPRSNVFFANAVFPTREALAAGVNVGLGTDISGGPSPSLFDSAATAVGVSRVREDGVDSARDAATRGVPNSRITFAESFWMATAGGGRALGLPIGLFDPGFKFDAVEVRTAANLAWWPGFDTPEDVVQKIIHNAAPANIASVWVDGRLVVSSN